MPVLDCFLPNRPSGGFFLYFHVLFKAFFIFLILFSARPDSVKADTDIIQDLGRTAVLDTLLYNSVRNGLINGAVLLVGNHSGTLYLQTVGNAGIGKGSPPVTETTVFDVASLTKVFATTPAIIRLMDQGSVSLLDPVSNWFVGFKGSNINILNLLTHTSGLHDFVLEPSAPMESLIRTAAALSQDARAGKTFLYADINFILLGNLLRRISSMELDQYCRENLYIPLGMNNTGFNPKPKSNTASTLGGSNDVLNGVVQDSKARLLGGVAGHAGLFSTAGDLAIFARMLLNKGQLNGRRVLSSRAVEQMTAPYYFKNGRIVRGLGWDRESPFSAPKGSYFSEVSYGHTGYSGTSVWIDPEADLFVILLTTRLDYHNKRGFRKLRSDISTLAASLFMGQQQRLSLQIPQNTEP